MPEKKTHVRIMGKVVHGDGYGKKLGFPTANVERRQFVRLSVTPRLGIYAGYSYIKLKRYAAAIVIGPLDAKGLPKVEAHLIGYSGNLYGKKMEIELVAYVRPFKPYATEAKLIVQIKQDLKKVISILKQKNS